MKRYIPIFVVASLIAANAAYGNTLKNITEANPAADKISAALQTKQTQEAKYGVIKPEHRKYIGKEIVASKNEKRPLSKNYFSLTQLIENTAMEHLSKEVNFGENYKHLDKNNAIYADADIIYNHYMPWHPQDVKRSHYDPDKSREDEMEIGRNIVLGMVYPSGDTFVLAKVKNHFKVYHYLAKRLKTDNPPFTEITGYDDSKKFKITVLKEVAKLQNIPLYSADGNLDFDDFPSKETTIRNTKDSVSNMNDYLAILERYDEGFDSGYMTEYMPGDEFRYNFIGDEKITDRYKETLKDKTFILLGIEPNTKTNKITKNVIVAKRVDNITFYTLSKINGKLYVHKFMLYENNKYSQNMHYKAK